MCCSKCPVAGWLKTLLFIWLIATTGRQAFDLIGRLWLLVLVNLIQILTCIAGIFAAYQRRTALLITLSVSCFFSILYNIALILWYNDVFGNHNRPVLALGLQYGYSFFVQHNLLCDSYFDVTTTRWTQKSDCLINYTIIESAQATLHAILAFSVAIFSILVVKQRWSDNSLKRAKTYDSRTQLTKIESGPATKPNNCRAPNSNSSASFMNSSYEHPEALVDPQLLRKKLASTNSKYAKHKPAEQTENYSSAPTIELNSNNTESPPTSQIEEEPKSQRLMRTLPERRSCGAQLAKILDQSADSTGRYSKIGNSSTISHSRRRSEHLLRPTASANNATTMLEEAEENPDYVEARNRVALRLANLNGEASTRSSPYHKRQGSAGNLTSLISFDPKSNTLIRVQEHQNDTDEEFETVEQEETPRPQTNRSRSQDSTPCFPAPNPPRAFEQASDSGHHSTTNSNNSPNWSQGGISFPAHFNPNYMPITQAREIPLRLNNSKSPESVNYEQVGGRLIATAFPVGTHSRQRSYCGVSVSTAMPLSKPEVEDPYYNRDYQPRHPTEPQNSPIVSTHFSRAFHDQWLSGQDHQSFDDLPPPPSLTIINTTKLPTQVPSDPHIEGLLV
ncbi:hypothetical protein M3Y97_00576000 [Aphelenchoides bicaudatus]|nr:hypothetical protein M3Y97_00576000 [Aphelenchoides bicaudatus]